MPPSPPPHTEQDTIPTDQGTSGSGQWQVTGRIKRRRDAGQKAGQDDFGFNFSHFPSRTLLLWSCKPRSFPRRLCPALPIIFLRPISIILYALSMTLNENKNSSPSLLLLFTQRSFLKTDRQVNRGLDYWTSGNPNIHNQCSVPDMTNLVFLDSDQGWGPFSYLHFPHQSSHFQRRIQKSRCRSWCTRLYGRGKNRRLVLTGRLDCCD